MKEAGICFSKNKKLIRRVSLKETSEDTGNLWNYASNISAASVTKWLVTVINFKVCRHAFNTQTENKQMHFL